MDTILSEQYVIMFKTHDGDYELCFDKENRQLVAHSFLKAMELVELHQENFDYPLVIVRETQTVIG